MPRRKDPASMRRLALVVALAASFLAAAPASADSAKAPDAAQLRAASEQFDKGVAAFKTKNYDGAAVHFEAADAAVPGPKALRQAIRARAEAGQGARAATLAAQALARYADDEATFKLATETLEKFEARLAKVRVGCPSPCGITVGTRALPGEPSTSWLVYLDPGSSSIQATFEGREGEGATSPSKQLDVKAGTELDLTLAPKKKKEPPPPPSDGDSTSKPPPSKAEVPPEDPKPEEPKPEPGKGISPAFFAVSLIATVGVGATTIWSGIDTQNNPGAAAVMAQCKGQGPSCPLYQEGLSKQTRTNALIGATAGAGALTVIFAIFTSWHGSKKPPVAMGVTPKPPAVEPTALVVPRGYVLGAAGAF
jgi:hypothetical protein